MKSSLLQLLILTLVTSFAGVAFAAEPSIKLLQPVLNGDGCPAGTATAVLSPDNDTISILFSAFQLKKAPQEVMKKTTLRCRIVLPFNLPAGYKLNTYQLDYRGFLFIEDPLGKFVFRSVPVSFPGSIPAPAKDMAVAGLYDGELNFSQTLNSNVFTQCGGFSYALFELSIGLYGTNELVGPSGSAIATIDSVDGSIPTEDANGVHLHIGLVPCSR
ncbi:MAG: DUF4360 domain-containing protein [Bdellovibrionota bacterium]